MEKMLDILKTYLENVPINTKLRCSGHSTSFDKKRSVIFHILREKCSIYKINNALTWAAQICFFFIQCKKLQNGMMQKILFGLIWS
jgi:hypothetical protein